MDVPEIVLLFLSLHSAHEDENKEWYTFVQSQESYIIENKEILYGLPLKLSYVSMLYHRLYIYRLHICYTSASFVDIPSATNRTSFHGVCRIQNKPSLSVTK